MKFAQMSGDQFILNLKIESQLRQFWWVKILDLVKIVNVE